MDKTKLNGKLSYITKSDGSARLCLNDTCVIVAIYGPGEVKMAKEQADKACINVIYKPLSGVSGVNEKAMEFEIRSILEGIVLTHLHPRTLINVVIQNVQNDGNLFVCALNACCLALLDANIPLRYTFAAIKCSVDSITNQIVPFPSPAEQKKSSIEMTFVFDSTNQNIVYIDSHGGSFSKIKYNQLANEAKLHSLTLFNFYRQIISNKYSKDL